MCSSTPLPSPGELPPSASRCSSTPHLPSINILHTIQCWHGRNLHGPRRIGEDMGKGYTDTGRTAQEKYQSLLSYSFHVTKTGLLLTPVKLPTFSLRILNRRTEQSWATFPTMSFHKYNLPLVLRRAVIPCSRVDLRIPGSGHEHTVPLTGPAGVNCLVSSDHRHHDQPTPDASLRHTATPARHGTTLSTPANTVRHLPQPRSLSSREGVTQRIFPAPSPRS